MKPLSLDLALSPAELPEGTIRGRQVVVIDVLRATTVIGHALTAGAEQIIPAVSAEQAIEFKSHLDPKGVLLCGEREGRPIPGFDLGNSPLEYRADTVAGRSLILASTNGSVLLSRCRESARTLILSFNNLGAVAAEVARAGGPWLIACSGKLGRPCLEDTVCAGGLVSRLAESGSPEADPPPDGVRMARELFGRFEHDLGAMLRECAHGRYLASIGFGDDLPVAAALDAVPLLAEMTSGRIVPHGKPGRKSRARAATPGDSLTRR